MFTSVLKRAGGISIGTAIGQGIVLLSTPWLVRIYGPASFGILALLITASNISIAVGSARFDLALPSADEEDVITLSKLCLLTSLSAGSVLTLIAATSWTMLSMTGPLQVIVAQPVLLGLCVFLSATFQAISSLLLRQGRIAAIALLRAVQGGLFVALAVWPSIGLLWAQVLSFTPACVFLPKLLLAKDRSAGIAAVAVKYRSFALFGLPGAILDVVGYSLCVWIVTYAYGIAGSGELSQVQRIVGAPLMLMSISLGQILLRQSAELRTELVQLEHLIYRLLGFMAASSAVVLALLALVGEKVLGWILGSKWDVTGPFIVAISAAVFIRAMVSPISTILATFHRLDLALRWQALYFVSALSLFTLASRMLSLDDFVKFYALHELVLYAIYLRIVMSIFRNV